MRPVTTVTCSVSFTNKFSMMPDLQPAALGEVPVTHFPSHSCFPATTELKKSLWRRPGLLPPLQTRPSNP